MGWVEEKKPLLIFVSMSLYGTGCIYAYLFVIRNHETPIFSNGKTVGLAIPPHAFSHLSVFAIHSEDPPVWHVYQIEVSIGNICWTLEENIKAGDGRSTTPFCRLPGASERVRNADIDFRLDNRWHRIEVHVSDNAITMGILKL